jgi:hypothetical protein
VVSVLLCVKDELVYRNACRVTADDLEVAKHDETTLKVPDREPT